MVFRSVAGSGDDPYALWMTTSGINERQTNMRTTDESVPGNFKSPLVDYYWGKVKRVIDNKLWLNQL